MKFPTILTINDVLPHIKDIPEIKVTDKGNEGYVSIDYIHSSGFATFANPYVLECRGLKFDLNGNIIARPLHKFFNVNENERVLASNIDWKSPHTIYEKLDGSMIYPCNLDGTIRLMTRAGITDVSKRCEDEGWLEECIDWFLAYENAQQTPIFEWTSPQNRIVIGHEHDNFHILAIRNKHSGVYTDEIRRYGSSPFKIPERLASEHEGDWHKLEEHTRNLENKEGYVVWFDNGGAVKVKSDWYVLRHKALDGLSHEHNVLRMVLEDALDDVYPLLDDKAREKLSSYSYQVFAKIKYHARYLDTFLRAFNKKPFIRERAEYAFFVKNTIPKPLHQAAFRVYDGEDATKEVVKRIMWDLPNRTRTQKLMEALDFPRWEY